MYHENYFPVASSKNLRFRPENKNFKKTILNLRIQTGVILLSRVIFNVFSSDDFSSFGFPADEIADDSDEVVFTET